MTYNAFEMSLPEEYREVEKARREQEDFNRSQMNAYLLGAIQSAWKLVPTGSFADNEEVYESLCEDLKRIMLGKKEKQTKPGRERVRSLAREVMEADAYRCRQCGAYKNLHVDHIMPVIKGGTSVMENLQTLCRTCNLKKGAKLQGVKS